MTSLLLLPTQPLSFLYHKTPPKSCPHCTPFLSSHPSLGLSTDFHPTAPPKPFLSRSPTPCKSVPRLVLLNPYTAFDTTNLSLLHGNFPSLGLWCNNIPQIFSSLLRSHFSVSLMVPTQFYSHLMLGGFRIQSSHVSIFPPLVTSPNLMALKNSHMPMTLNSVPATQTLPNLYIRPLS